MYSNEFVYHRLVGPLRKQRGYGVVSSVENQKQGRNLCQTEVKQRSFGLYPVLRDTQNAVLAHNVQTNLNLHS